MCAECNAKSAWKDPWQSCYFTCSTITNVKFPREITKNRITGFWSGVAGNYLHFGQNFLHKSNEKCRRLHSGKFDPTVTWGHFLWVHTSLVQGKLKLCTKKGIFIVEHTSKEELWSMILKKRRKAYTISSCQQFWFHNVFPLSQ